MYTICGVVAVEKQSNGTLAIGCNGHIPWKSKLDMQYFKQLTTSTKNPLNINVVIMGTKTWQSLGKSLPGRINIIVSTKEPEIARRDYNIPNDTGVASSVYNAISNMKYYPEHGQIENVFIIGGSNVYREAFDRNLLDKLYITYISSACVTYTADAYFPYTAEEILNKFVLKQATTMQDDTLTCCFSQYVDKRNVHQEYQYLNLVNKVLNTGKRRNDRTGTGTISLFGETMRFNLEHEFPLITTKKTFWRGVVEELLWFISGSTDAKLLQDKNIHIWDGNSSRKFLDSVGLPRNREGDIGPVYGFQWRHFGADYTGVEFNYDNKGIDQLRDVIYQLKTNPTSRRILMSAWNPDALKQMALPPCHVMCQFYVDSRRRLSCQMYQRSADIGLGVPFNIASYALLTCLIAHCTELIPGEFIHVIGDAHIYTNHIEALQKQIKRTPYEFPKLSITDTTFDLDKITASDILLTNYKYHPSVKMEMSA